MFWNRWLNYFISLPTLFTGITNFPSVALYFLFNKKGISPVTLTMSDGAKLKVYTPMDVWTAKEIYLDKDYEHYGRSIQDGWVVIDIGAAFGDFVVLAAKQNKKAKIYAFEPYPKYFKLLQENIATNKLKNVFAFPYAIGSKKKKLSLYVGSGEAVTFSTSSKLASNSSDVLSITAKSLEQIFKEEKIKICDFLKIDCEGGEYDIFFNTTDAIFARIRYICMEYHDKITQYKGTDLAEFLEKKGFAVKVTVNPYRHETGFLYATNTRFKN